MNADFLTRHISRISPEPNTGCWLWTGNINGKGYGVLNGAKYATRQAHRLSYEAMHGAVPDGLFLDHLCRVRCCVNPDHLEPVTTHLNNRRGWAARFSGPVLSFDLCVRGHNMTGENRRINVSGAAYCVECFRNCQRRWAESERGRALMRATRARYRAKQHANKFRATEVQP